MRVFVAGGTGVVGRRLVPQLVSRGHQVTATTTSAGKRDLLRRLGAEPVVMNGLDAISIGEAVAKARPQVIVHEMTAINPVHAGKPDIKHMDRWFATTIRLRTEGTDHLLAAAQAIGAHFIAQSYASWNGVRQGGWVKTEEDPLDLHDGTAAHAGAVAIRHVEDVVVKAGGAALRYGALYGAGATDDRSNSYESDSFLWFGKGTGYSSWVHLRTMPPSATVLAVSQQATGVYNVVDDEPAPASEWLPYLAACAEAKPPMRVPKWLASLLAGDVAVMMMTEGRGFSNEKAKSASLSGTALPLVAPGLQGSADGCRSHVERHGGSMNSDR